MTRFIDEQRVAHGVEPIYRTLAIAPSSYYAARSRPASARAIRDALVGADIGRIHRANYAVYGARKVWHVLRREGVAIGRDQVGRVMRGLGLVGAVRGKTRRTTVPSELSLRPVDLVERVFAAAAPNRLWVADITYVSTWTGFVYFEFRWRRHRNATLAWTANDLNDMHSLATVVVHCDIVVTERHAASLLREACLDARNGTVVLTDLADLAQYLVAVAA